jgi:hypothetical protein
MGITLWIGEGLDFYHQGNVFPNCEFKAKDIEEAKQIIAGFASPEFVSLDVKNIDFIQWLATTFPSTWNKQYHVRDSFVEIKLSNIEENKLSEIRRKAKILNDLEEAEDKFLIDFGWSTNQSNLYWSSNHRDYGSTVAGEPITKAEAIRLTKEYLKNLLLSRMSSFIRDNINGY